jgi:hypothetical protein
MGIGRSVRANEAGLGVVRVRGWGSWVVRIVWGVRAEPGAVACFNVLDEELLRIALARAEHMGAIAARGFVAKVVGESENVKRFRLAVLRWFCHLTLLGAYASEGRAVPRGKQGEK